MKGLPGTRNIVVTAITAVCIVAALVFAMAQPTPADPTPFHLVIECANGKTADDLSAAVKHSASLNGHPERYNLKFDDKPIENGHADASNFLPCGGNKASSHVTQLANFVNGTDLTQFIKDAGL